jgi:pyridoxamine 5'-phosphate oxidase
MAPILSPVPFHSLLEQFRQWLEEASNHPHISEPTAMCLATADSHGLPATRIVLLKGYDERGFVFYTNYEGAKSVELKANPQASLLFYWMPLMRQVRIAGAVEAVSATESDTYFATRPRGSQIGAWASLQSQPMEGRETLLARIAEFERKFEGKEVPRPPHWGGWRVVPQSLEFWQEGEFRLHERVRYLPTAEGWQPSLLFP